MALLASENAVVEAADTVSHALDWYAQGADFADALHLSACDAAVMHTFDREFCTVARRCWRHARGAGVGGLNAGKYQPC